MLLSSIRIGGNVLPFMIFTTTVLIILFAGEMPEDRKKKEGEISEQIEQTVNTLEEGKEGYYE